MMLTLFERPATILRILSSAAIGLCLFAAPAHAQLGLGLAPMRVELRLTPGQEYSGSLKLSSGSGEVVRVRGDALDFTVDDTATPQFETSLPQETGRSCKDWLELNPTEAEIDKGGALTVRYTLRLPTDLAVGSYACAAAFSTLPPVAKQGEVIGMRMALRIVATFYLQIGAPTVQGQLKALRIEPAGDKDSTGDGWRAVVVIENQGLMYFRPTGTVDVLDESGRTLESLTFAPIPVLREREQRFLFPLKTPLAAGHYQLRARVDLGTGDIQQGIAEVVVDLPGHSPLTPPAVNGERAGQ